MNRIQNHKEGGVTDTYDRHGYEDENKRVMEAVASHLMAIVAGKDGDDNVVQYRSAKKAVEIGIVAARAALIFAPAMRRKVGAAQTSSDVSLNPLTD